MKNIIYILFVIFLSVLGIFIMIPGDSTIYSRQPVSILKGVDFSKVTRQNYSGNSKKTSFINTTRSLIPETYRYTSNNLNSSGYNTFNNNLSGNYLKKRSISFDKTGNVIQTNASSGTQYSTSVKSKNISPFSDVGTNSLMSFGNTRKSRNTNQNVSSGFLAKVNSQSSGITALTSVQTNPFNDYNENDITHPGGNPNGNPLGSESIPVGDGTLPFLLFISSYVLNLFLKKNRNTI